MPEIPPIAKQQCGVFASFQAEPCGWTRAARSHAVRSGRIRRLRPGAYQVADLSELDEYEQRRWRHAGPGVAAALTTPGADTSHTTAAVLLGLPLLFLPARACVVVPPWLTGAVPGVHLHRCPVDPERIAHGAIDSTGVERTALDLAREHGVVSGVLALDAALHRGMTTPDQVSTALDQCVRWPAIRSAREAAALADGLSESPLETRSRLKFGEYGIPAPRLQVPIGNAWGGFVGRVDFYWDEFGVVGEADGAQKYDGSEPLALAKEKARQEELEDLNLGVVRWGSADLMRFDAVAQRLRRAFARAAARPAADRRWTVLPPL